MNRFDPICDCGHSLRQHIRTLSPFTPSYCTVEDCECREFREVGQQGQDYEAGRGDAA